MGALVVSFESENTFTMRPNATSALRTNQRRVVKKMVLQAEVAEEHRVPWACYDNPKEFIGYVNKHKPRAPLGPVFFVDGHLLTMDE